MGNNLTVSSKKRLVLGLGNEILGDDSFGPVVAQRLRAAGAGAFADITECSASGFRLLDLMEGYDEVIIVDSWLSEKKPPGQVMETEIRIGEKTQGGGSHFYSFPQALAFGRAMGQRLPKKIIAVCASIKGYEFSDEGISPQLEPAAEEVVKRVMRLLLETG